MKLTVTDDLGAQNSTVASVRVSGAKITSVQGGDSVPLFMDLRGEHYLFGSNKNKSVWIFVKEDGQTDRLFPQTLDSCHPQSASMQDSRWESRITVGSSQSEGDYFEILATLADEKADQQIRSLMKEWWCPDKKTNAGFSDLPDGVHETHRIRIKRSSSNWSSSQDISNIQLTGAVNILAPKDNSSVDNMIEVSGNRSRDAIDRVWVLVHTIKNGRWYPQSTDNENNSGHVTNVLPLRWAPDWYIDTFFNGDAGDPYELAVVLANSSADKFFNDFQKRCARDRNPDGTSNYTGLLTIALPPGIDEKDRVRVNRSAISSESAERENDGKKPNPRTDIYINSPSKAIFSFSPIEPIIGQSIAFNASRCEDPEKGILKYMWDFGEGRAAEEWKIANAKHTYDEKGSYNVTLTVEDDKGATCSSTSIIRVWPDLLVVTASYDKTARIWDASSGQELHKLNQDGWVYGASFSPDGTKVVSWGVDQTSRIWDVSSGREVHRLTQDGPIYGAAFSPDGTKLASYGKDGTARIWDISSGQEVHRLTHDDTVWQVTFSPDGKKLATACKDGIARIWDVSSGREIYRLNHTGEIHTATFSPDGTKVLTSCNDSTARIWDASSGLELYKLNHDGPIRFAAFSPDGTKIVTGSYDSIARIWNASSGQEFHRLNHGDMVCAASFSPDGTKIVTGSYDSTARIWDVSSGQELHRLNHGGRMYRIFFSPGGTKVATSSEDNTARIWDVSSGQELLRLSHDGPVYSASFSPG